MNYADIKTVDIQDGEGVRVALYVSGCHFHCKGCHNAVAWDFKYGKEYNEDTTNYILDLLDKEYISGLSLLGGEPLEPINQEGLLPLVKKVKEKFPEKNIWCYTGYDFEKDVMGEMYGKNGVTKELLDHIDVMVDGQFIEAQKTVNGKFKGSDNQRILDVRRSIEENGIIKYEF